MGGRLTRLGRRGVAGPWVAMTLVALLGVAALVFDIGRLILVAQRVQAVADAAALAGALTLPDRADCEARILATVAANNELTPACVISVSTSDDLTYFGPGDEVPGYGDLRDHQWAVEVVAHSDVSYVFARIVGVQGAHVTRSATALGDGSRGAGDGLIFAGETRPQVDGIRVNGSDFTVRGTMHSNTRVRMNGSFQTVTGAIEYLHAFVSNGSSNDFAEVIEDQVRPYPVNYEWAQFDQGPWDYVHNGNLRVNGTNMSLPPGRWRIDGDLRVNGSGFHMQDALVVCTGDIVFNGSGVTLDRVTLVARGRIDFNGTTERFSCFQDDLFAFSLSSASTAIRVNGAESDTWGILFAPNGGMIYNGADQEIHHGGLVALTIDVNGAGTTFEGMGGGSDEGFKQVKLIR